MAAMALLAFSCTKSEEENILSTQDYISLNPDMAITYAAMMDLDSLKNDPWGFSVYALTNDNNVYINGDNNVYDGTGWGFSTQYTWPASGLFPMTFYVYYPNSFFSKLYTVCGDCFYAPYDFPMLIPSSKDDQEDLLFAREIASDKPISGELSLEFKHILSKVNFTVSTTETNQKVYVLAAGFCNLFAGSTYLGNISDFASLFTPRNFDYFNSFEPLTSGAYLEKEFVNATNVSFYSSAEGQKEHLFLLPQEPDVWDVTSGPITDPDIAGKAYIRVLYRYENATCTDSIGYAFASNHPTIKAAQPSGWSSYNEPLYLLVGYTFFAKWKSGESYSYNIPLPGSGGGILLDTYFYDNQGNQTDLEFNGNLYDHVLDNINCSLSPLVNDWDHKASKKSF